MKCEMSWSNEWQKPFAESVFEKNLEITIKTSNEIQYRNNILLLHNIL